MKNESQKKLVELTVVSFTTDLCKEEQKTVRGGSDQSAATIGMTSIPVFCK